MRRFLFLAAGLAATGLAGGAVAQPTPAPMPPVTVPAPPPTAAPASPQTPAPGGPPGVVEQRDQGARDLGDRDRGGRDFGDRDRGGRDFGDRDRGGRDVWYRDRGGRDYGDRDFEGRGMRGPMMGWHHGPPRPPRGASFHFERGDAEVNIRCAANEPMRACAEAGVLLLDRLGTLPQR